MTDYMVLPPEACVNNPPPDSRLRDAQIRNARLQRVLAEALRENRRLRQWVRELEATR